MSEDSYCFNLLRKYAKDRNLKLVDSQHSGYQLTDFSVDAKGRDEDEVYALFPKYWLHVRRGNTFVQVFGTRQKKDYFFVGRRGLPKFFDLRLQYLHFNTQAIQELPFKGRQLKVHEQLYDQMFGAASKQENLIVYQLQKANGQNVQVSWARDLDKWMVCSKNVSMAVSHSDDVADKVFSSLRYSYARQFSMEWLSIVEKLHKTQGPEFIKNLKDFLDRHTFVGEYVGHPDFQHLVRYEKTEIIWFAVVSNTDQRQICLPVLKAMRILKQFRLRCAHVVSERMVTSWKSLNQHLLELFKETAKGPIDEYNQGVVVYLQKYNRSGTEVISIFKIKNLEYRLYRKIREKVSSFNKLGMQTASEQNFNNQLKKVQTKFIAEVDQLCSSVEALPPYRFQFYTMVLRQLLQYARTTRLGDQYLRGHFIDLLDLAHYSISIQKPMTVAMLNDKYLMKSLREIKWRNYNGFQPTIVFLVPMFLPATGKRLTGQKLLSADKNAVDIISHDQLLQQLVQKKTAQIKGMSTNAALAAVKKSVFSSIDVRLNKLLRKEPAKDKLQLHHFIYWDEGIVPKGLSQLKQYLRSTCVQLKKRYQVRLLFPSREVGMGDNSYCFSISELIMAVLNITSKDYQTHHIAVKSLNNVQRARLVFQAASCFEGFDTRRISQGRVHYIKLQNQLPVRRTESLQQLALQILDLLNEKRDQPANSLIQQFLAEAESQFKVQQFELKKSQREQGVQNLLAQLKDKDYRAGFRTKNSPSGNGLEQYCVNKKFIYLGLQFEQQQMQKIFEQLPNSLFKYTKKRVEFHLTTLYCATMVETDLKRHPTFKYFQEGRKHRVKVQWVVILPEKLVVAVAKTDLLCQNKVPHIILAAGEKVKADEAIYLLQQVKQRYRWVHKQEVKVKIGLFESQAIMWRLRREIVLNGVEGFRLKAKARPAYREKDRPSTSR